MPGWIRLRARRSRLRVVPLLAALGLGFPAPAAPEGFPGGLRDAFGPLFEAAPRTQVRKKAAAPARKTLVSWVRRWNQIAIDASGLDHTPPAAAEQRVFGESSARGARRARWRSCTSPSTTR
jgi:hypothetical protein